MLQAKVKIDVTFDICKRWNKNSLRERERDKRGLTEKSNQISSQGTRLLWDRTWAPGPQSGSLHFGRRHPALIGSVRVEWQNPASAGSSSHADRHPSGSVFVIPELTHLPLVPPLKGGATFCSTSHLRPPLREPGCEPSSSSGERALILFRDPAMLSLVLGPELSLCLPSAHAVSSSNKLLASGKPPHCPPEAITPPKPNIQGYMQGAKD